MGISKDCPKFLSTPIISGMGKAMDFKSGQYIHRVHPNKSPLEILEKREHGRIQGLPNFFGYLLLSQERVKLRTSNLAGPFTVSIRIKAQGLMFRWTLWIYQPNLKSVAFPVPEIIGGTQKIWAVPGYAHAPFSPKLFNGLLFGWTLWMVRPNLKFVVLPVPEII